MLNQNHNEKIKASESNIKQEKFELKNISNLNDKNDHV